MNFKIIYGPLIVFLLLILTLQNNKLLAEDGKSSSDEFYINYFDQKIELRTPDFSGPHKAHLLIQNTTSLKIYMKITIENSSFVKNLILNSLAKVNIPIEIEKDKSIIISTLTPAFQDIKLPYYKSEYVFSNTR